MKMIWLGIAVAVGLAIVMGVVLSTSNPSTTARYQTENVRL